MKKNLVLYILLGFLLVVNGFFLFNHIVKPERKGAKVPENFIVEELEFDKSQLKVFHQLNKDHSIEMKQIFRDIRHLKDALFDRISITSLDNNEIDSIATLIGNKEKERDLKIFDHFRNIQDICNEKQKEKFKLILKDALHKGGPGNRKRPPRGRHERRRPPLQH